MSKDIKIFRDPIYNLIFFDKIQQKILIDLINTPDVQRLKRIRQLGMSWYTFPSSTHDRFSHSLGVCFLSGIMFDFLKNVPESINIQDVDGNYSISKNDMKTLVQISALLHDIGHGPFSHAFESISNVDHEKISIQLLSSKSGPIYQLISGLHGDLGKKGIDWIKQILDKTFSVVWVRDIISSQLDVDRIDYLLRDAYMCGAPYVKFDWEWIFNHMMLDNIKSQKREGVLFEAKRGIHSLESFIVSRYHMYEQVYFHKSTRGAEKLVQLILLRVKNLIREKRENKLVFYHQALYDFFKNIIIIGKNPSTSFDLNSFCCLDDFYILSHIHVWAQSSKDRILKELCGALIRREFKMVIETSGPNPLSVEQYKKIKKIIPDEEAENYFVFSDNYIDNPYKDTYLLGKNHPEDAGQIWLTYAEKQQKELAEQSIIIQSLRNKELQKSRVFALLKYHKPLTQALQL